MSFVPFSGKPVPRVVRLPHSSYRHSRYCESTCSRGDRSIDTIKSELLYKLRHCSHLPGLASSVDRIFSASSMRRNEVSPCNESNARQTRVHARGHCAGRVRAVLGMCKKLSSWSAFRCARGTCSEMVGRLKAFGTSSFSVCWGSQQASTDVYPRYAALAVCTLAISPFAKTGLGSLNPAFHFGRLTSVQYSLKLW